MITVQEAEKIINQNPIDLGNVSVKTLTALGRVLQENVYADRDFPPFDRVTMDGIAIKFADWEKGQRKFKIQSIQFAGQTAEQLIDGQAIEIMTGAVCPFNADTIIRFEDIKIENINGERWASIQIEEVNFQQNLHFQGIDQRAGNLIIPIGTLMGSAEIAATASVGKALLQVKALPKICIISNGDELVDIEETPLNHQVRRSNVYALAVALNQHQFTDYQLVHLPDNQKVIEEEIAKILTENDIIILSGGVSQGYADYIPQTLANLGVNKLFHQVQQRPGKPFWFGKTAKQAVFALPGNPVSTIVCFYRYVLPYLYQISGTQKPRLYAQLAENYVFKPNLTYFLQVQIRVSSQGVWEAIPETGHGSGDFMNLLHCSGFLELPNNQNEFQAGQSFPFWSIR
jgi:molybdopterin molybdotransferase